MSKSKAIKPQACRLAPFRFLPRRFRRDNSGVAAVEFAMVAGPFFLLLFAMMEVGFMFLGQMSLENAIEQAGREIRTGQAQAMTSANFKTAICNRMAMLRARCNAELNVDVRAYTSFTAAATGATQTCDPRDANGAIDPAYQGAFQPGNGGTAETSSIIIVCASLRWEIMSYLPTLGVSNMAGNNFLIMANRIFRNEPF